MTNGRAGADAVPQAWLDALEARHLANLRFADVTRGLRAVSARYVEARASIAEGRVLDGEGKRAAFALYYAPLHFVVVRALVRELPGARDPLGAILDLGCGTGASGAAWASAITPPAHVTGIDTHPWTLGEAVATYRAFGVPHDVTRGDAARARWPRHTDGILAAYVVNELGDADRHALLPRLLERGRAGARVLVVEPVAGRVAPWWPEWARAFEAAGGRADEWRIDDPLPGIVKRLASAAGLRPHPAKARSLWMDGRRP